MIALRYFSFCPLSAYAAIEVTRRLAAVPTTVTKIVMPYAQRISSEANSVLYAFSENFEGISLYPSLISVFSSANEEIST